MKGKLFIIEGVDGSGKETQTKRLYERLKSDLDQIVPKEEQAEESFSDVYYDLNKDIQACERTISTLSANLTTSQEVNKNQLNDLNVLKNDKRVQGMVDKYDKTIAQILLRFDLQLGVVPLTKSVHESRIKENFEIFDFEINEEDMTYLKEWIHPEFKEPDNKTERPPQVS